MTVVQLRPDTARSLRDRLYRPQGGRDSSELDIVARDQYERMRHQEAANRARQEVEQSAATQTVIVEAEMRTEPPEVMLSPELEPPLNVRQPTINAILSAVADYYKLSLVEILAQRKQASIVRPRQVAMYLAKALTTRSLPVIGKQIGDRDHTTVLHGARKIEGLLATDPGLQNSIDEIKKRLGVE